MNREPPDNSFLHRIRGEILLKRDSVNTTAARQPCGRRR
jgi:hypothetical protein